MTDADDLPLAGIRVLDVSGPIGSYGTKVLADLGADVVLAEPPGGDPLRWRSPRRDGVEGPEAGLAFADRHANKRGITLDVTHPGSLALLERLGPAVDVVAISPSRRRPLTGFDDEALTLSWVGDAGIVCSVTPFGLTGPLRHVRATHLTSYAISGAMHPAGPPEGPPLVIPGQLHWDLAAAHGAFCVVAALAARDRVGGQLIDVSAQEVEAFGDFPFERWDTAGEHHLPRVASVGYPPTGNWECRDGLFDIAAHQAHHWDAFLQLLDDPEELREPALRDPVVRQQLFDGLRDVIAPLFAERSREDLFARGQQMGLPTCIYNTPGEFVRDPQLADRGALLTTTRPGTGTTTGPGPAVRATPTLSRLRRPAPTLGEHDDEVYRDELGFIEAELLAWRTDGVI